MEEMEMWTGKLRDGEYGDVIFIKKKYFTI
jgi:hypothetical protein